MKKLRTLHDWVDENLEQAYRKQAAYYDLGRRDINFQVDDLVLKRHHVLSSAAQNIVAKLSPKFHGPFRISRMLSPVVCEVVNLNGDSAGKVHVQDLKPYHIPWIAADKGK